ncbi:MAG: hypothetical protein HY763_02595 [Planctomycetes bacterium]|nr:hypothetical protein [Planctomycetota bacterium]
MSNAPPVAPSLLGLLFRVKARTILNRLRLTVQEAPVRLTATVFLVAVIWVGLYGMFYLVFEQLRRTPLEATVAIPLVFNFFFAAMLVLLTFSNAVIAYGALFGKEEAAYLLAAPITPLDVVTLKYWETLIMASWALVLLGFPLMLAMADLTAQRVFYVLFLAFFLAFIPIPAALGVLLAWSAARFFPRRLLRPLSVGAGVVLSAALLFGIRALHVGDSATEEWLRSFQSRMAFVQSAFLPNNWVALGIDRAMNEQIAESVLYLGVTAANGLFLTWLVVRVVARRLDTALDRASGSRGSGRRFPSPAAGGLSGLLFFYLPTSLRLVAAKDLRTFFRDPLQWSQLAILFGLLALYLTNMPTLRVQLSGWGWYLVIPFLNLCAVSLILATFTCRFVFPLVSLEGRKLWLVGLLPVPRGDILIAKFAFAMTVTLLVALTTMIVAMVILKLAVVWAAIHVVVTVAICFGLCGFSVGIGARLPMFRESNAARIANGLGGTTNLLASITLVALVLSAVGSATWRARYLPDSAIPDTGSLLLCSAAVVLSFGAGALALTLGRRHFDRVEV